MPARKSHMLCGVWILFRSVENAEIEDSSESIPTLIPQTGAPDRTQPAQPRAEDTHHHMTSKLYNMLYISKISPYSLQKGIHKL